MLKIIDGRLLAENIKDEVVAEVEALCQASKMIERRPNLAIILVGEREDSKLYVSLKEREARKVGIDTHLYKCADNTPEQEILDTIVFLNNDPEVDAILVQLPLPAGFDTNKIITAISPIKDVDRFHPKNVEKLLSTCDHAAIMPPLFQVVLKILNEIKCDLADKRVAILYNSDIFGRSLKQVLECRGAMVDLYQSRNNKLQINEAIKADVVISAVGQPHFIKKEMIEDDVILIDIGVSSKDGKMVGDVDFDSVKDKAGFITPVPGGVGPMTIAMLFQNVVELYRENKR